MVENISYVQGSTQALVIIHCFSEQGMGGLDGCIGLSGLLPVLSLSTSCVGRERHGSLVYKYTWSIWSCATWCNISVHHPATH